MELSSSIFGSVISVLVKPIADRCSSTETKQLLLAIWKPWIWVSGFSPRPTEGASCSPCVDDAQHITEKQTQAERTILSQSGFCPVNSSPKERKLSKDNAVRCIHEEGSSSSYQQVTLDHRAVAGALDLATLNLYFHEGFTWVSLFSVN